MYRLNGVGDENDMSTYLERREKITEDDFEHIRAEFGSLVDQVSKKYKFLTTSDLRRFFDEVLGRTI